MGRLWSSRCAPIFCGMPSANSAEFQWRTPTFFQDRGRPCNRHSISSGSSGSRASTFSIRRQRFRAATAVEQDAILQSFKSSGETAEDYFGGWTVEKVVTAAGLRIKADSTPADTPATRFASRRFEFRRKDTAAQEVQLKRITASGQTPEAYFGGQSLDKVRNPFSFDKNATPQALALRRFHFRKLSAAKQEELLQNIKDIDETPEAYFGKGFTVAMVRSKFDFGDVSNKTWNSRRLLFKNKTEAKRQKVLKEIQDAGKTPKDFFGGWTVEQVLSGRSPKEMDFSINPGTQSTRRNVFRKHSTARRQEILRSIQDAGKTPEDYFGEGYGVDEVLNGGR